MTIQQYSGAEPRPDSASRNRRAMIEKVWAIWITGILQPSLPHDILLDLGLTERPAIVTRALDLYVQRPTLADQVQAPGTPLIDVFDRLDRALLILGAPGAGKTTLLLTLARDLLIRAAQDPEQPIPVVFPLSSWARQHRALVDWLVDALNEQYDVPRKTGQAWVETDQILPLLDGLDEVKAESRAACVEAINTFRQDRGLLPLVVCSRVADYEALGTRLQLQGALVVQPLTPQQVDSYLTQVGAPLAAVRQALQDDPTLWQLLDTPLMLTIVSLAYAGEPVEAFRTQRAPAERRQRLFATYVDRMLRRRGAVTSYPRQQTEYRLAWLAWQLAQHNQTIFYLERLQPDWLPSKQSWIPAKGRRFFFSLLAGLILGLVFGWQVVGLASGLLGGLIFGLVAGLPRRRSEDVISAISENIIVAETLHWSWSVGRAYLFVILSSGLYGAVLTGLVFSRFGGLAYRLSGALLGGLIIGLAAGLSKFLSGAELKTTTVPNEGIRRSARNAILVSLGAVPLYGFIMLVIHETVMGGLLGISVSISLSVGPLSILALGLRYGGFACLQHLVIRFLFVRNGFAPWRYTDFLDYAAERAFLRKVGGGYMFMHQLLQDYFSRLLQNYFAEPLQDHFAVRRPEPDRNFPLECPNCGLLSPPSAMRCDCGYTFIARHRPGNVNDRD